MTSRRGNINITNMESLPPANFGLMKQQKCSSNIYHALTSRGKGKITISQTIINHSWNNAIRIYVLSYLSFFLSVNLPIPAYLLALVYFFLSLLSVVMMVGLRGKKTRMLLAWMIFFLLAVFPEAGMVLFMGVYYWVSDPV